MKNDRTLKQNESLTRAGATTFDRAAQTKTASHAPPQTDSLEPSSSADVTLPTAQNIRIYWKTSEGSQSLAISDLTTFGSDTSCQIQVPGENVCARHARIERREERFVLRDLRSSTGTLLNGVRILEAYLRPGDEIQIARQRYIFGLAPAEMIQSQILKSQCKTWSARLNAVPQIAKTPHPVLLLGPSGTGKELLARTIHDLSHRAHEPFVSVNCSALSESLIESELFGHVRGSFTGATHDRPGAFASAKGGTLFLDEIGDFPLSLQPKLLRALENCEIRPVGSDQTVSTDVRIVAATHQNLLERVALGTFRADLFYRLHVIRVNIPSLRERPEDFMSLLFRFARENRVRFSVEAIEALRHHPWPGNIRELKNAVARASVLFKGQSVTAEDVPQLIDSIANPRRAPAISQSPTGLPVIKELEREMIIRRLVANHGNQRQTATDLNMPKSTLHDRLKTYEIDVDQVVSDNYY